LERVPSAVVDPTDWIALPDGGSRVVTLKNGKRVRTVATTGLPLGARGFEFEDVSFASATTGWATASSCVAGKGASCTRRETTYRTVDGGASWTPLNVPG
jgi:hypothetical protein